MRTKDKTKRQDKKMEKREKRGGNGISGTTRYSLNYSQNCTAHSISFLILASRLTQKESKCDSTSSKI